MRSFLEYSQMPFNELVDEFMAMDVAHSDFQVVCGLVELRAAEADVALKKFSDHKNRRKFPPIGFKFNIEGVEWEVEGKLPNGRYTLKQVKP